MKIFRRLIKSNRAVFDNYYENDITIDLINKIDAEYEALIPQIPYIGGKDNYMTDFLISSAQMLSVIIVLENKGESKEKIGKIIYDIMEHYINSFNRLFLFIARFVFFSKRNIKKLRKASMKSKEKNYSFDWVFDLVDGQGNDFTYGYKQYECGIYKFYKKLGYEKYAPYLCLLDYPKYKALKIRLDRTKTIANGADLCDFKFFKTGDPIEGWPPEKLTEFKIKQI